MDGVGKAWCDPAEIYGQGSVGVYVATEDLEPVTGTVLSALETYVDSVRPVPAYVNYATITELKIRLYVAFTPYNSDLEAGILAALQDAFLVESGPGYTIKISSIRSAIASVAPDDYEIIDIAYQDEYGTWIPLDVDDIDSVSPNAPVLNAVFFSELS